MRPFQHTIPLDQARAILEAAAQPTTRVESVRLGDLPGRVLAEDVIADADVPPFARAMMDGYAVRAADTAGASPQAPAVLHVIGRVFTGEVFAGSVAGGAALEIATGAPLPDGADAVVMVEATAPGPNGRVQIKAAAAAGQHIGRPGGDVARGTMVLRSGDLLWPGRLGLLAALGRTSAIVVARPRVAIVSTGNEVVPPGQPLAPGQIHDINGSTVAAIVAAHGGVPEPIAPVGDTIEALDRTLDRALASDVIVFSGGSSVGDRDLVLDVLRRRGEVAFHGIATRPGKPTAFGHVGTVPVFAMPGNPTSCLTNAYVLLVPFLRRVARLPPHRPGVVRAALTRRVTSAAGRHQFYTVRLLEDRAEPAFKASADITSMANADGYIEIAADVTAVEAGADVDVVLFA
jgi:molybdopterin molybdotransferase